MSRPDVRPQGKNAHDDAPVSTQARVLAGQIDALTASMPLQSAQGMRPCETQLWLSGVCDAVPDLLLSDPMLEPIDKIVWVVLRKTCADVRSNARFPSLKTIARLANVASEATVKRALTILRATRWLTVCFPIDESCWHKVYILHPAPLSRVDTVYLDPDYETFLRRATTHTHARVRLIVAAVSRKTKAGRDVSRSDRVPVSNFVDIRSANGEPQNSRPAPPQILSPGTPQYLRLVRNNDLGEVVSSIPRRQTYSSQLVESAPRASDSTQATHPPVHGKRPLPQNLRPQNLRVASRTRGCSCCFTNKDLTTTTTTAADNKIYGTGKIQPKPPCSDLPTAAPGACEPALPNHRWPDWLSSDGRRQAEAELARVPDSVRQALLDQLDSRWQQGARPELDILRYPLRYLRSLCELAIVGRIKIHKSPRSTPPPAPEPAKPNTDEKLRQKLVAAEFDHRHWLRLLATDHSAAHKANWQSFADRALADIERYQAELRQADGIRCQASRSRLEAEHAS